MIDRATINSLIRNAIDNEDFLAAVTAARDAARSAVLSGSGVKMVIGNVNGVYFQASDTNSMSPQEWYRFLDLVVYQANEGLMLPNRTTIRFR